MNFKMKIVQLLFILLLVEMKEFKKQSKKTKVLSEAEKQEKIIK